MQNIYYIIPIMIFGSMIFGMYKLLKYEYGTKNHTKINV